MKDNKFSVLKYTGFTFLFLIILLGVCFLMLTVFLPRVIADFSYDLGFKKFALHYYERTYELNKDDNDLFNALTVAIIVGNHEKVISFYEKFENCTNYEKIINEFDQNTKQSSLSVLAKSALLNEKNYLINSYVYSLIKTNNIEKAVQCAYDNFDYDNINLSNLGTYAFSNILTNELINNQIVSNLLNVSYNDTTFSQALFNYFEVLVGIFNSNYNLQTLTENNISELIYLAKRINQVTNNLLVVSTKIEHNYSLDSLVEQTQMVNQKLSELLNSN